jgi:hypothetical protein
MADVLSLLIGKTFLLFFAHFETSLERIEPTPRRFLHVFFGGEMDVFSQNLLIDI